MSMKKVKCPACLGTGLVVNQSETGAALRKLRKRPQSAVAGSMGITASHLCYLESGKRRWTPGLIEKYKECCR
jgi:predicted transcriptional regulator